MRWRPWMVTAATLASTILAVSLLVDEDIVPPKKDKALEIKQEDPLLDLGRNAASRIEALRQFGFSEELAGQVSAEVTRVKEERGAAYRALLKEGMPRTSGVFCNGGDLPPRYKALEFLVNADEGKRNPIEPGGLIEFMSNGWYAEGAAGVEGVFKKLELEKTPGATGMGIAAILLEKEADAMAKRPPWKPGSMGGWDLERLFTQHAEAGLRKRTLDYFTLFQVLYEFAYEEQGICTG